MLRSIILWKTYCYCFVSFHYNDGKPEEHNSNGSTKVQKLQVDPLFMVKQKKNG